MQVQINLTDSADHYLPASQTYAIPNQQSNVFNAQNLILLTKDGKGCVDSPNVSQCWAGKTLKYTNVDVTVKDELDGEPVEGRSVKLYSGLSGQNYIGSQITNKYGVATFPNLAFDQYQATFEGDNKYIPASNSFPVQSEKESDTTLFLHDRNSTAAVIEEPVYNIVSGRDQDLGLKIKAHGGSECNVDPLNKWCAYAEHVNDVSQNNNGFERIRLNKFTVSHYLTYMQDAPPYSGTCAAANNSTYKYYPNDDTTLRSLKVEDFNWNKVRKLASRDYQTLYCFTGWGLNSKKTYRKSGNGTVPSAGECSALYPTGSPYNLDKLKTENNK